MPAGISLDDRDLIGLAPGRAVDLFRRLLWCEASRLGIATRLIDVPQCINVADGGLDARITDVSPAEEEVIPGGEAGFQIKASDMQPQECVRELHQRKDAANPLKPAVKSIMDAGGTYVLVLFAEMVPTAKERRQRAIEEEFVRWGYPDPKVRVFSTTQIVGFAGRYPSLVTLIKQEFGQCLSYDVWAGNTDVKFPRVYVPDEPRTGIVREIQAGLRDPNGKCPVFRVTGLPGLGKTRLVFEALKPDDLRNRVIYVKGDSFPSSDLCRLLQNDDRYSAIVIADECSLDRHDELVRALSSRGARLALITLSYDMGSVTRATRAFDLERLQTDQVREIIGNESPGLPASVADRIARLADGYPRIASLLAESFLASPDGSSEDLLAVTDQNLLNRLIAGRTQPGSDEFNRAKKVLMGLALFEKVGYGGALVEESRWVAGLARVTWEEFQEVVRNQRDRRVIQGDNYLYVTPFLLVVHLVREWWRTYGEGLAFQELVDSIPASFRDDLLRRFYARLPYIGETVPGKVLIESLLGEKGVFADGSVLRTDLGARFFLNLAEADPPAALACLKRTIGTWSKAERLSFTTGRSEVIWALERIAMWKNLFHGGAQILLLLGEAENETYSNNASGVFAGLFSPAYGRVAPTEASPEDRFPVLVEAMESESVERKRLALRALKEALETRGFHRLIGAEYQGGRRPPELWRPRTYEEWFDAYRRAWNYFANVIAGLPEDVRTEAFQILIDQASGLLAMANVSEMVCDTLADLSASPWADRDKILATILRVLHLRGSKIEDSTRSKLEALRDRLTGTSYADVLRRYVGMNLFEDYFDEKGNETGEWKNHVKALANRSVEEPEPFWRELPWLLSGGASKAFAFGLVLGESDPNLTLLTPIVESYMSIGTGDASLLGGFLKALSHDHPELLRGVLDRFSADSRVASLVPEIIWYVGLTDSFALRVLELAKSGAVGVEQFGRFRYGGAIRSLSEGTFRQWAAYLLEEPSERGPRILLDLFYFYYCHDQTNREIPRDLAIQILLHRVFMGALLPEDQDQMVDYYWMKTAEALVRQYPDSVEVLADALFANFGNDSSVISDDYSEVVEILDLAARKSPVSVWKKITPYMGPPSDDRAFYIAQWLRGRVGEASERVGALACFRPDDVWQWIDLCVDDRAWYFAYCMVPPALFWSEGKVCWAREVLVRYGDRDDVRRNLVANFETGGWSGPASEHYETKRAGLLEYLKHETNQGVVRWVENYARSLADMAKHARVEEEREGR